MLRISMFILTIVGVPMKEKNNALNLVKRDYFRACFDHDKLPNILSLIFLIGKSYPRPTPTPSLSPE